MKTTTNLGFKKPEASDYITTDAFNENADKLDKILPQKADLDPDTNKLKAEQFPDAALSGASEKETLADADSVVIVDSSAEGAKKRVLWSKIRALFALAKHASQHATGGSDPIVPADIGAAAANHTHSAGNINSGTLDSARLPTVPLTKGGTGQTSAASALYALINGSSALTASGLATGDILALGDVSAAAGKKVTLANLFTFLQNNLGAARIEVGSYVGTGVDGSANKNSWTFSFPPKVVLIQRDLDSSSYNHNSLAIFLTDRIGGVVIGGATNGGGTYGIGCGSSSLTGNTFEWWDTNKGDQMNVAGSTYTIIGIG